MSSFIDEALLQAHKSPMTAKYGAVLVYRNKVISYAYNTYKTYVNSTCCVLRGKKTFMAC